MDNYFKQCPPMMADGGRHLQDYKTATRRNEYIKYINDIWRNDQYRLFLQKNGKLFMNKEWSYNKTKNSCFPNHCVHNNPTRANPQELLQERLAYDSIYDARTHNQMKKLRVCKPYADYRLSKQ